MKLYTKEDVQAAVSQYAKGFQESSVSKTVICAPTGAAQLYQRQGWEDALMPKSEISGAKLSFVDEERCGAAGVALVRAMREGVASLRDDEFGGTPEQRAGATYQILMRAGDQFAKLFERKTLVEEVVAQLKADGFDVVPKEDKPAVG